MREWLTVIIVLLIIGIILDGIRRVRVARREQIHMGKNMPNDDLELFTDVVSPSEFPSGGARVAAYRHPEDVASIHKNLKTSLAAKKKTLGVSARPENASEPTMAANTNEPSLGAFEKIDEEDDFDADGESFVATPLKAAPVEAEKIKTSSATTEPKKTPTMVAPEEVIVINVMARADTYFNGGDLLDVLTEQNCRFGDMEIFHRHKNEDGSGEVLFSLANIVKPGIFDLNNMSDFDTPGVSMFMMLPLKGDAVAAFGLMARAAKAIATALGGEIKDENRSVMTQQTFEHCRQRVIEFERKRRLNR